MTAHAAEPRRWVVRRSLAAGRGTRIEARRRPAPVAIACDNLSMKLHRPQGTPLLFLDLETGGLDAHQHEILEVGAVLTDSEGRRELGRIDVRVRPERPERIDERAQAVNGYAPAGWLDARPLGEVLVELLELAQGATLVGHNICFDWGFILVALRARGLAWSGNGRWLDTMALAPRLRDLPDRRLLTMARHLGIPVEGAHCAIVDAEMCRAVFLRLVSGRPGRLEQRLPADVVRRSALKAQPAWFLRMRRAHWRRLLGWPARSSLH